MTNVSSFSLVVAHDVSPTGCFMCNACHLYMYMLTAHTVSLLLPYRMRVLHLKIIMIVLFLKSVSVSQWVKK